MGGFTGDDAFKAYKRSLSFIRLMSDEEKLSCYADLKSDNERIKSRASNRIVECNLALVISIAAAYSRKSAGDNLMDLIQEGNRGLIHAVSKYNPGESAISTYATHWITAYIREFLYKNRGLVSVPRGILRVHDKIKRSELDGKLLSSSDLSEALDEKERDVKLAMLVGEGDVCADNMDFEYRDNVFGDILLSQEKQWLEGKIAQIKGKKQSVMRKLISDGVTQTQVGKDLGLSRQSVSQVFLAEMKSLTQNAKKESMTA
jgi:RNA polymerase sigma factor (sigma-70 family)